MPAKIHVGTSGWQYDHWKGPFYPEDLSKKEWFDFFAKKFSTVEINRSFYQLPSREVLGDWKDRTGKDFVFSYKASRYITHMKKLKDPEDPVSNLFDSVEALGEKLGPVLFQLPPKWKCNPGRLKDFLEALPKKHRYTFEFRDPSWFCQEVYDLLSDHKCAFCIFEIGDLLSPKEITTDFIYIRLHGPGEAYQGRYGGQGLSGWAGSIQAWKDKVKNIYCYFDNDQFGYATQDALQLKEMAGA